MGRPDDEVDSAGNFGDNTGNIDIGYLRILTVKVWDAG